MRLRRYGTWARSLLSPRARLIPGLGARLARRPRLARQVLRALARVPEGRARALISRNISRPLLGRMDVRVEVPVRSGFRMIVDTGDILGRTLVTSGVWEPPVTAAFEALLSRGDVCVDVGANVGYYSLLASRVVGEEGRVIALEPSPTSFARLRQNIALNAASNVTPLAVAAGSQDGHATLVDVPRGNAGASFVAGGSRRAQVEGIARRRVPVRPVHAVLGDADPARIRLVKVDVEGYEAEVLKGVEPLFERGATPALIVEWHPDKQFAKRPSSILDFCRRHELTAFELVEARDPNARFRAARHAPRPIDRVPDRHCVLLLTPA